MPSSTALAFLPHPETVTFRRRPYTLVLREKTSSRETSKLPYSIFVSTSLHISFLSTVQVLSHPIPQQPHPQYCPTKHSSLPSGAPSLQNTDSKARATRKAKKHNPFIELQPVLVPAISLLFHSFIARLLERTASTTLTNTVWLQSLLFYHNCSSRGEQWHLCPSIQSVPGRSSILSLPGLSEAYGFADCSFSWPLGDCSFPAA